MFELLRSPKTGGFIPASPVSLLFLLNPNLSVSYRQACALSLRNAASWRFIWDRLMLPFTLKLPQAAPRCRLHLYDGMPDLCLPQGGGR
jgi:hypothetical protein